MSKRIADRPEFAGLRPDLLKIVRDWELIFTAAREEALALLPPDLRELWAPIVAPSQEAYLVGLAPFFETLSGMLDETEILRQRLKGAFN